MIRALWVALVTIFSTVRYGTPVVYHARRRSHKLKRLAREYPRLWTQKILRAARVKVEVEGREHLETATPCVLVANHQSWFDVLALTGWLPSNYRFVAKKELESVPFFGPGWQALGHISIDRRDRQSAIESLERAARLVREESRVIVMFPEGTRSPDGEVKAFKKGAFVLAIRAGVPVVPVAIVGTREILPKGSWRARPGVVRVRVGAPIPVVGLGHKDRDALSATAHAAVAALKAGGPAAAPKPVAPAHPQDGAGARPPRETSGSGAE